MGIEKLYESLRPERDGLIITDVLIFLCEKGISPLSYESHFFDFSSQGKPKKLFAVGMGIIEGEL